MKILFAGGGSGGSVSPLIALAIEFRSQHPKSEFLLVGTYQGPEKLMAREASIKFTAIHAGKLRRFFSFKNLVSPFQTMLGFYQSLRIIQNFKPNCIVGAGSFVQVPVIFAGWILKIPIIIHQQDLKPSLANKICEIFATKITVTFEESLSSFASSFGFFYKKKDQDKVVLTGNPFRTDFEKITKENGIQSFNLKSNLPVLLVLGGGTGSEFINNLVVNSLPALTKSVQILHSTGRKKSLEVSFENYHQFEFIHNMGQAYASADIVVSRAGLSTITELSNLKKLSIIIPMPMSHQEFNGLLLIKNQAALVLRQKNITSESFVNLVRKLLFEYQASKFLTNNISKLMPHNSSSKIVEIITKLISKNK